MSWSAWDGRVSRSKGAWPFTHPTGETEDLSVTPESHDCVGEEDLSER